MVNEEMVNLAGPGPEYEVFIADTRARYTMYDGVAVPTPLVHLNYLHGEVSMYGD